MTNRSLQETLELVAFGLIALLVAVGVLWLMGWVFSLVSWVFLFIAGLLWTLLRFILPIIVVAAVIYLIVKLVASNERRPEPQPAAVPAQAQPPTVTAEAKAPPPPKVEAPKAEVPKAETPKVEEAPAVPPPAEDETGGKS